MKQHYILATDLDGTLVGNTLAMKELFHYFNKQYSKLKLIYVTGRHLQSAKQLMEKIELPTPDILICDVGSTIYVKSATGGFTKDKEWEQIIAANWSSDVVLNVAQELGFSLQSGIPFTHRVSLHVTNEQEVKRLCQRLTQSDIASKVIYSSGKDLDILPEKSGKGNALTYALQKYYAHIKSVLVAGNSGNDLEMLCLGYPSVIVGNADPELQEIRNTPLLYKARAHYASGIKEAWESFFED